jgi:hypothetical protein
LAKTKNWAYTDFSKQGSLILEVDGEEYKVAQLTMTFALNEVPKCTCLVAVGRDARDTQTKAKIHETGPQLSQMKKAKITFKPEKEWDPKGTQWEGREVIFDGYYVGLAWRKVSGKVQAVMHLIHWLIDLSHSSTLSKFSHPSNPTSLVAPAIMPSLKTGEGGGDKVNYVSSLIGDEAIRDKVTTDLWEGIKELLCAWTDEDRFEPYCGESLGTGDVKTNVRAKDALKRIQGPGGACDLPYDPDMGGFPLPLNTQGVPLVPEACARAITDQSMQSWAHLTFLDVIIGVFGPQFNMALVPQIEIATMIAHTPALDQIWKKEIKVEEYEAADLTGMISKPLAGVAVYGEYESMTAWESTEVGKGENICIGGSFAEDAEQPGDGQWLVIKSPAWLRTVTSAGLYAGSSSGLTNEEASQSSTAAIDGPKSKDETPGVILPKLGKLYNEFAHTVFVANMLRGRGANVSSKLRFDIAPGSVVKLTQKAESFLEGTDEMATDMYGHVNRVTCNINAEASRASTSFQMSHLRTPKEFTDKRTSVSEHPLFGANVYRGAPLVKNWVFDEDPEADLAINTTGGIGGGGIV